MHEQVFSPVSQPAQELDFGKQIVAARKIVVNIRLGVGRAGAARSQMPSTGPGPSNRGAHGNIRSHTVIFRAELRMKHMPGTQPESACTRDAQP